MACPSILLASGVWVDPANPRFQMWHVAYVREFVVRLLQIAYSAASLHKAL